MDFFADFVATQTISVNPPGGTHHPAPTDHLPLPTADFVSLRLRAHPSLDS